MISGRAKTATGRPATPPVSRKGTVYMEVIKRDTDYAFRALVHLALKHPQVVSAGNLAADQGIPIAFLQKLLQRLTHAGLVQSHRGVQGGFALTREPREISAEEIVEAIQGEIAMNRCLLGKPDCQNAGSCPVQRRLAGIQQDVKHALSDLTLEDLAADFREGGARQEQAQAQTGKGSDKGEE